MGQTTVSGGRVQPTCTGGRTLPAFPMDSTAMLAGGWCRNSYVGGLTPGEFFQHAKGGREELVDTSVKTAYTGYIQRRLSKLMEAVVVLYDGTVRTSHGKHVISFRHGGNGLSSQFLETARVRAITDRGGRRATDAVHARLAERCAELRARQRRSVGFVAYADTLVTPLNQSALRGLLKRRTPGEAPLAPAAALAQLDGLMGRIAVMLSAPAAALEGIYLVLLDAVAAHPPAPSGLAAAIDDAFRRCQRAAGAGRGRRGVHRRDERGSAVHPDDTQYLPHRRGPQGGLHQRHGARRGPVQDADRRGVVGHGGADPAVLHPYLRHSRYLAQRVANAITRSTVGDLLLDDIEIVLDGARDDRDPWVRRLHALFPPAVKDWSRLAQPAVASKPTLRIVLDRARCHAVDVSMDMIVRAMRRALTQVECDVLHSEECMNEWVIRVVVADIDALVSDSRDLPPPTQALIVADALRALVNQIGKVVVKGVHHVTSASVSTIREQHVLTVKGGDVARLVGLECVDPLRSHSWDPTVVAGTLGIIAARAVLRYRLHKVLADSGAQVNWRHPDLLVRCMTYRGILVPVSRHGMARSEHYPPLMRASFEEPVDVFRKAATDAKLDMCDGVSPAIMLGRAPPLGTGIVRLVVQAPKAPAFVGKRRRTAPEAPPAEAVVRWDYLRDPETILDLALAGSSPEPQSPPYEPQSPPYEPQSPPYVPQSPPYVPQSPPHEPQSPPQTEALTFFVPRSPLRSAVEKVEFRPRSPARAPRP